MGSVQRGLGCLLALAISACELPEGQPGPQGAAGPPGPPGPVGMTMVFGSGCNRESVGTVTGPGSVTTRTAWYADIEVPGLDFKRAPRVTAVLCDRVCWGPSCDSAPTPPCLGSLGAECKASGDGVHRLACVTAPSAINPLYTQIALDNGRVVVGCGLRVVQTGANAQEYGVGYRQVYVSVQQ